MVGGQADGGAIDPQLLQEPDAHLKSRHLQTASRALIGVFAVAAAFSLFFAPEAAYLAAIPIPILYCVLVIANSFERSTRASRLRRSGQARLSPAEVEMDEEVAGVSALLKLLGALAAAAILIAASLFGWKMAGLAAAGVFLYLAFMMLPYWPLFLAEAKREEHEKVTGEAVEEL